MADPLSIAASIAGLASLAGTVFKALNDYRVSVRDASTEVATFATELRTLSGMLQNLSLLAGTLPLSEGKTMSLDKSQISEMEEMMATVDEKISKATKDFRAKRHKRIMRSLRWHFSKEEVDKLVDQIRSYKATVNLALSSDTLDRLNECLKIHQTLKTSIMSSQETLRLLQAAQDLGRMDKKNRETFDFFSRVNPQPFLQTSLQLREETTGEWLVQDPMVTQWMSVPSSRLWLSGIPGAGKTVLCGLLIASILENLQSGTAFAFFFCDYKEPATQTLPNILSSIALQLALQKSQAFDILQVYHDQLHPKNGLPRDVEPNHLMDLILDMSRLFDRASIVIDALDECDSKTREVARGLVKIANQSHNLSIAVFSREIIEIIDELEPQFQKLEVAARNEDLELYISNQMMMRTRLSKLDAEESREIRERLLSKAQGMFRWVACQLDSLEDMGRMARKTALDELPPTLNKTYDRILQNRSGYTVSREVVRRTLHWICYDKLLPINVLQQALTESLARDGIIKTNNEVIGEDEITRYCSSLVRKSQSGNQFEIAHFTVEEYLRSGIPPESELGPFRYSALETSQSMTLLSLWFILRPEFEYQPIPDDEYEAKIRERTGRCPFYDYASAFWPSQTECHDDPFVNELLQALFGPQSTAQFQNWLIQFLIDSFDAFEFPELESSLKPSVQVATKLATHQDVTPLHVAASLSITSLCDRLLQSETRSVAAGKSCISLLDCALLGPYLFHIVAVQRFGNMSFLDSRDEWQTLWILQITQNNPRTVSSVEHTMNLFHRKINIGSFLGKRRTGPLAINASVVYETGTIFSNLLDESHEDYLTRDTVEAIKFHFELSKPPAGSALHHIIQRVLDLAASTEENCSLGETIRLTQEMVRSGGAWDQYSHLQNQDFSLHFEDDRFEDLLRMAAAQDQATEVSRLLQDARFDPRSETTHGILTDAVTSDRVDVVRAFLEHFSPIDYETNKWGSIWHIAAQRDSTRVIQLLLEDVSAIEANLQRVSPVGRTPFAEAMWNNSLRVSKLLLPHCGNDPGFFLCHPPVLHLSVLKQWPDLFHALLKKHPMDSKEDFDGQTPLFFVRVRTEIHFILDLLERYSPDHQDKKGQVAFQCLIQNLLEHPYGSELDGDHIVSIFQALAPTNWMVFAPEKPGQHMWKYFCQCLRDMGRAVVDPEKAELLKSCIGWLCKSGAVDSYEQQAKLSSLVPLTEALENLDFSAGEYRWEQDFVAEALKHLRSRAPSQPEFLDSDPAMVALLEKAVQQDHYGLVSFLTERGTPTHGIGNRSSPLIKACASGSVRTFSRVLWSTPSSVLEDTTEIQPDILHRLISAAAKNKHNRNMVMQKLLSALQYGLSPDTVVSGGRYRGRPPIVIAAEHMLFEIVDLMLEWDADPLACEPMGWDVAAHYVADNEVKRLRDLLGRLRSQSTMIEWSRTISCEKHEVTFLHLAGSEEMVDFILRTTSMIGVESASSEKWTPLHVASYNGSLGAIKALIRHGATTNAVNMDGKRPLDLASEQGHDDAVLLLQDLGAVRYSDINARVNNYDDTPLSLAVRSSGDDCRHVRKLLDDGADIALRNNLGWSALMEAARYDLIEVARLLVEANAPIHAASVFGETLLHISARHGSTRCFVYFVQLGCDAHREGLDGTTALHEAVGCANIVSYRAQSNIIYGATIRVKHYFLAAICGDNCGAFLQIVRSLPRGEVPLLTSARRYHECSVLCAAVSNACTKCITTLLTHGADIEMEGSNQGTPLMQACAFGQLSMVKLLVRNNAQLEYVDTNGVCRSAFDEAQQWPDVIQWLLVERFQDQLKLSTEAHNPEAEIKRWDGSWHLEYDWKRYHAERSDESQIDHLKLMTKIKAEVRGKVVKGRLLVKTSEASEGQGHS